MKYRNVGKSGLKVSEIAVGSWMTDLQGSEKVALAEETIRKAYDAGVNFFDCADAYSGGEAEKFLGRVLKDYSRSSYVVSSKVFFPTGRGVNEWGLSRKHIFENIFLNQIKTIVRLSKKYNIKINIVEHTRLLMSQAKLTILPVLEKAKKIMKNTNTKIVFENIYMMEEQENCSVIELCEYLNSENMKVCIDMCHLYCQAHIYKKKIEEFLEKYLNKEKCQRQVYQIHFAYTANEDGYIDRTTHAIMHPNEETLYYDAKLLCQYGMGDCNWITEVSEKDYSTRKDQVNEIKMLSNQKIKLEE